MPRQAARLVLGRSARAALPLRPRPFSTTPRRLDDDAGKPTMRERSVAAASALGAMSRPSNPTESLQQQESSRVLDARRLGANRPAPAVVRRPVTPGGPASNVISLKSLPRRSDGSARPLVRRTSFPEGGQGGQGGRPDQGAATGATGRFVRRPTGAGIARASNSGGGRFQGRAGGGGGGGRVGGGGGGGGGGGMRGRSKTARKPRSDDDKKKREDDAKNGDMSAMDAEVRAYVREQEIGGVARAYTPSTTLESLIGWGPAVATNTALGQADLAVRNMRLMGGGRPYVEGEQSLKFNEVRTALARNKPIFFTTIGQKKAAMETISHEKRERVIQRNMDATIQEIQKTTGDNWGAFVGAFKEWSAKMPSTEIGKKLAGSVGKNPTPEAWLRALAEYKANANLNALAVGYKTQNTKTAREAITKYALKGEHPEVKYAEDVYGKLAMYHAHGSTYRAADGQKFDEKMRKLIRVPVAGNAAPKAQARS